jgi:hypothetical protein
MTHVVANRVIYAALAVLNLVIGALILQIGKGAVPIPESWQWIVPVILAALNGIALFLPRVGGEDIAAQSDVLRVRGTPRHKQVVVTEDEAAFALGGGAENLTNVQVQQIADEIERRMKTEPSETEGA